MATTKPVKKEMEMKLDGKYISTVGRRKTSTARVRLVPNPKVLVVVNGKAAKDYFKTDTLRSTVEDVLNKLPEKFAVTALVKGGGVQSQAEAVRHGIARALVVHDLNLRADLKKSGYLKRDPRSKERRKFGFKKARKSAQWSKR